MDGDTFSPTNINYQANQLEGLDTYVNYKGFIRA